MFALLMIKTQVILTQEVDSQNTVDFTNFFMIPFSSFIIGSSTLNNKSGGVS